MMNTERFAPARIALACFGLLQSLLSLRVLRRMLRPGRQRTSVPATDQLPCGDQVAVIVPVLNERERLAPCLDGLIAQGDEVSQILVVDGGSRDGTQGLVASYAGRDERVRLIDASPVPPDWNGKAWGLQRGFEATDRTVKWILTIDADVRPRPRLARSLIWHARRFKLQALSVATRQEIETPGEGLVHPSLLTTLVYRFGIPGGSTRRLEDVQANGQCFLIHRHLLTSIGEFTSVRDSICEDVTLARQIAVSGRAVGFYETDDLVSVRMYRDGWTTMREWPRSLPMRDRFFGMSGVLGLAEVLLVQAVPLPLLILSRAGRAPRWLTSLQTMLVFIRIGVLFGTRPAYIRPPRTYWLSPLFDLPASGLLLSGAVRRRFTWRGRLLAPGGTQ